MTPPYEIFSQLQRQRVSDGDVVPVLTNCQTADRVLILIWPQLGDFDSLEYAWWLNRASEQLAAQRIEVRAVGIGDRAAGQQFCDYTGFPSNHLLVDPTAELHAQLQLYPGLQLNVPGFSPAQNAGLNLLLMCAGIGSPGTLAEVLRGYLGDRSARNSLAMMRLCVQPHYRR
jgi:hypothetical protein